MNRLRRQSGSALVVTLAIAAVLLPVGSWMLMQTRADFLVGRNLRAEIETLYVAEAGIADAAAQIEAEASFDRLLGVPPKGGSPFVTPPPAFPESPFRYEVVVTPLRTDALRLLSTGYGRWGGGKRVEAILWRDAAGVLQLRIREDL